MRIEMRRALSGWLGKLILLAGSLALALGAFEVALRGGGEPTRPARRRTIAGAGCPVEVINAGTSGSAPTRSTSSMCARALATPPTWYEFREDRWDRRLVWNRLARSAQSGGFRALDLTDALRRADGPFRSTYYGRDGHWNERGHRVAAAELARWLRHEGWTPACP